MHLHATQFQTRKGTLEIIWCLEGGRKEKTRLGPWLGQRERSRGSKEKQRAIDGAKRK